MRLDIARCLNFRLKSNSKATPKRFLSRSSQLKRLNIQSLYYRHSDRNIRKFVLQTKKIVYQRTPLVRPYHGPYVENLITAQFWTLF